MFGRPKIKTVPKHGVIDKAGEYYLDDDFFSKEMFAIKIECNNVTLDLNGYGVYTQLKNKAETAFGIYAIEATNIYVMNGKISGSSIGIHAPYNKNLKIRAIDIKNVTHMGMNIGGGQALVSQCHISDIGGHTSEAYAIGINSVDMVHSFIEFNWIENIYRQNVPATIVGEGVGILLGHQSETCLIQNNIVTNRDYRENTFSIWAVGSKHRLDNNIFCNSQIGVYMGNSTLFNNIIMLRNEERNAVAVKGGMGICSQNSIINYPLDYQCEPVEGITEAKPFVIE